MRLLNAQNVKMNKTRYDKEIYITQEVAWTNKATPFIVHYYHAAPSWWWKYRWRNFHEKIMKELHHRNESQLYTNNFFLLKRYMCCTKKMNNI